MAPFLIRFLLLDFNEAFTNKPNDVDDDESDGPVAAAADAAAAAAVSSDDIVDNEFTVSIEFSDVDDDACASTGLEMIMSKPMSA